MSLFPNNTKFRTSDFSFYPLNERQCLIINPSGDIVGKFPIVLTILVEKCRQFKSFEDHLVEIWYKLPFSKRRIYFRAIFESYMTISDDFILSPSMFPKMLIKIFEHLANQKVFISFDEFNSLHPLSKNEEIQGIQTLAVMTNNRPADLLSGLGSFLSLGENIPNSVKFVVFDDSREQIQIEECMKNLKDLGHKYKKAIYYCGFNEKEQFINEIVDQGISREVMEFALFGDRSVGPTYGANRNAFLLDTVDERVFSVDDDIQAKFTSTSFQTTRFQVSNDYSLNVKIFKNRQDILESLKFSNENPLLIHNNVLGEELFNVLKSIDENYIDTEKLFSDFLRQIRFKNPRIRMTFPGIAGDSGSNSSEFYLFQENESLQDLTKTEDHFKMAIASREIIKCTDKILFSRPTNCMTTCFGLDNTSLLPPFFPVFRNEDHLFTELLRLLNPDDIIAHLPWVFVHGPSEPRSNGAEVSIDQPSLTMDEVLKVALSNFQFGHGISTSEERLKIASLHIQYFLKMPLEKRSSLLQQQLWANHSKRIMEYGSLLKKKPALPVFMRKEIERIIKNLQNQKLSKPYVLAPDFLVEDKGEEQALQITNYLLFKYSSLLDAWPSIYKFAKVRKKSGKSLSQILT